MRMTASRTALCLAVLMTGCQSPSLRESWFTKNPFAANKPSPTPTPSQVATQQPATPTANTPAGTQTTAAPLQPINQPQPALTQPPQKPAASPIIQTGATLPAQSARGSAAANERVRMDLERGVNALRTKRFTEAKMAFENVLNVDPQNLPAHHQLGQVYDMQQRWSDAERHYLTALALQPDNPDVLSDLGYSYVLQGRFDDAIEKLTRATALDPGHKTATLNMGAAYAGMGETNRALYYFRKVVPEDKASELLSNELQRSINRNRAQVRAGGTPSPNLQNMSAQDLQREMARIHEETNAAQERLEYLRRQQTEMEGRRRDEAVQRLQFDSSQSGGTMPSWKNRANGIPDEQLNARMQGLDPNSSYFNPNPNAGNASFTAPQQFSTNGGNSWNGQPSPGGFNVPQPGLNSFGPNSTTGETSAWNGQSGGDFNNSGFAPPGANSFSNTNGFENFNGSNSANLMPPNGNHSFGTGSSINFGPGSGLPNLPSPTGAMNSSGSLGSMPNTLPDVNAFHGNVPNGFNGAANSTPSHPLHSNSATPNFGANGWGMNGPTSNFNPADGFSHSALGNGKLNGFNMNSLPSNLPNSTNTLVQTSPGAWNPGARNGFGSSTMSMPSAPTPGSIQQSGGPVNVVGDPGVKQLMEATQLGMGAGPGSLFNFADPHRPAMSNSSFPGSNPSNMTGMGMTGSGLPLGTPMLGTPPLGNSTVSPNIDPSRFRQMPTWSGAPNGAGR